jgi:hypothetical protein
MAILAGSYSVNIKLDDPMTWAKKKFFVKSSQPTSLARCTPLKRRSSRGKFNSFCLLRVTSRTSQVIAEHSLLRHATTLWSVPSCQATEQSSEDLQRAQDLLALQS